MLRVFIGNNIEKRRERFEAFLDSIRESHPHANFFSFDDESFDADKVRELIYGQELFGAMSVIVFTYVLESAHKELLLEMLPEIATSTHEFVFLEKSIKKPDIKKLEKYAQGIEDVSIVAKKDPQKVFNVFSIGNALGERDKKSAWILYQEALQSGLSPEEIQGSVFWQYKHIYRAMDPSDQGEGVSPYAYKNAKRYAKNFSKKELERILRELVVLYHEAREGEGGLENLFEKFLLRL